MPKLTRFDEIISNYGHFVVRWRWLILLVSILLAAAAITGTRHLEFKSDYRIWFSAENPQLQAFERLQRMYTKNDNILFVLAPQGGDAFAPEVLAAVEDLTAEAWRLPYAIRVDSISNFQHTEAEQDDLVVADLIEGGEHFDETETARVRDIALAEPALADRLIADDTAVTAVSVTFQMPELRADEVFETATAARQLAQRIENDYPLIDTYLTGVVMLNTAFPEAAIRDYTTLIPAMYGVIIVTLLLLVRSIAGMIGTVVLIALAAGSAFGLAGYAGIKLSPPAVSALTMIMTLSVADAVHLMMSMRSQMQQGLDKTAALIESLRINFGPIFLTSLTTAIGFASMNFADAPPFRDLGNITATGVMIAFLLSVSFLPAFISICPMKKSKATRMYSGLMNRLADFVIDKRRILLPVMALSSVAVLAFIPKNELNDEFVKYFDERIPFRTDTDFAVENLTGIYQIQYSLDTGNSNGISDPEFLAQADAFTHWLREQPETV
ncbi:MAG: MMPL family transporter, partial [Gammaproteobacteria bacterium]